MGIPNLQIVFYFLVLDPRRETRNGISLTVEKMDEEECKQEQEDEHEALESMFMEDEFKIINPVGEKDPWFVFNFFLKTFSL